MKKLGTRARTLLCLLLLALATVMASTFAGAQSGGDTKLDAIRKAMEEGQGLFIAKKYTEAAAKFEQGFSTYKYSAFAFNAGVCYTKLNDVDKALEKFNQYVQIDPNAPDIAKVKERIAKLEAAKAAAQPQPVTDAGADADVGDAGVAADAGAVVPIDISDESDTMRSLVIIETDPPGAPVKLFQKTDESAKSFQPGQANPGWKEVAGATSPANVTLAVGKYHVVVDKFRDFNVSQTEVTVEPGKVLQFKANLSQGAFMAFLRVSAKLDGKPVNGAHIYIDDEKKRKPEWGTTPYGELIAAGDHTLLVEKPGYQPLFKRIEVKHGDQTEIEVLLERVDYGYVRIDADAPEVKVAIDDEPKGFWRSGEAPLEIKVPAGQHRLRVSGKDRKTYEGLIDVPRGQVIPIHAKMIPKYPRGGAWTQAAVGAAVIGAGVFMGIKSDDLHSELKADREAGVLDSGDRRIQRGRLLAIGANGAFALGGVLAILSTVNFIRDPLPESTAQIDELEEFYDPLAAPAPEQPGEKPAATPPAATPPAAPAPQPKSQLRKKKRDQRSRVILGPSVSRNGGGLVIGGTF